MRGKYIIIEGADGVGKTTQLRLLEKALKIRGCDVACTNEPGGTPVGNQVRRFLLEPEFENQRDPISQLLGFNYARAILVRSIIAPFLNKGTHVLTDRSWFSTIAYQAFAEGVELGKVKSVCELAMLGHMPDHVFILDVPIEEARRRLQEIGVMNHYDSESDEFHKKIREGYRWCADRYSSITTVIDGTKSKDEIASQILKEVLELIEIPSNADKAIGGR